MAEDPQAKLKTLLDNYERKQAADKQRAQQLSAQREEFERSWQDAIRFVIGPAAQPILDSLKARGHQVDMKPGDMAEMFSISITPKGTRRPAVLSFMPEAYSKSVTVVSQDIPFRGGSRGGPGNKYALSQLKKEIVEKELMAVVLEIFAGDR